jgi:uncharacterized protein YbjT (DUF2867 family)
MGVLLTGAGGFIGGHITAALLREGHEVVAAVRDPARMQRRFPAVRAIRADLNDLLAPEDWSRFLDGVDAAVNCAGILTGGHGQSIDAVHDRAPSALFDGCEKAGVTKVVQISIVSIGGDTAFARTKRQADDHLQTLALDWTVLRPSLVLARDSYGGPSLMRALAACPLAIPLIGRGNQPFQPILAEDLAETVLAALDGRIPGRQILYPCGPDRWTLREMTAAYRQWLGLRPVPFIRIPLFAVRPLAWLGERLGAGPVTTTALTQLEYGNEADPALFAEKTGIAPRRLADFLADHPAGPADLWHARLYLARPLVLAALVLLWLASGVVGLLAPTAAAAPALAALGIPETLLFPVKYATALLDIGIAALLLSRASARLVFHVQLWVVAGYTAALSWAAPGLWLDLFGPLVKNVPILALILVYRILREER